MARPKEPVELLLAKGKKHLTKDEIEQRRSEELDVPFTEFEAPSYLKAKQKEKFNYYAGMLLAIGIFTELDVDCLARYIIAHDLYLEYTKKLNKLITADTLDIGEIKEVQTVQDKAFKQAQTSARDLGLTITSRVKLVVPQPVDTDDEL